MGKALLVDTIIMDAVIVAALAAALVIVIAVLPDLFPTKPQREYRGAILRCPREGTSVL